MLVLEKEKNRGLGSGGRAVCGLRAGEFFSLKAKLPKKLLNHSDFWMRIKRRLEFNSRFEGQLLAFAVAT